MTPFDNFKKQLRNAGWSVQCQEQFRTDGPRSLDLWIISKPGEVPRRFFADDRHDAGYDLFMESAGNSIQLDVELVTGAGA